jgi:hypothetical protein
MRTQLLLLVASALSLAYADSTLAQNLPGDSVNFISASTDAGGAIGQEMPMPIVVTVAYRLNSHKSAFLRLNGVQFEGRGECNRGGQFVGGEEKQVKRGSGTLTIRLTWPSRHKIFYDQGAFSLIATFSEKGQNTSAIGPMTRFGVFDFFQSFCATF